MRYLILFLGMTLLLGSACSDSVDSDERRAAESMNAFLESSTATGTVYPGALLNLEDQKSDCVIGEGATTGIDPMSAECEWKIRKNGEIIEVDVVEKWKCADFNERAGRPDFCKSKEGSHIWHFAVDGDGVVEFLAESGDASPETFYLPSS